MIKKIGIRPNRNKDIGLVCTKRIVDCLLGKAEIFMDKTYEISGLPVTYTDSIYEHSDAVIVLGGDGTILRVAGRCVNRDIPILGINLGRVGFMSEIEVDDIENAIERLLSGDYIIQDRMMMEVTIRQNGFAQGSYYALNDVVISKDAQTKLSYMKLYADGEQVNEYVADGVIVATPTGSTGYSLSAGGPVVDPLMELFLATPVCAHMLSARAAVLSADKTITLKLDKQENNEATVMVDGDQHAHIKHGDEVIIKKAEYSTKLIKMGHQSFYDTLIKKLS